MTPDWPARSTANDDGADTAASTGTPAITAFWVISNDARPLTSNTLPLNGIRPASTAQPITLSTALWRPTSSRTASTAPSGPNSAAPCRPPVLSKTRCAERSTPGIAVSVPTATVTGSSPGQCRLTNRTASRDALPQTPHDEVV